MIADASVLLCAFFPDESQAQAQALLRHHAAGRTYSAFSVISPSPDLWPSGACTLQQSVGIEINRRARIRLTLTSHLIRLHDHLTPDDLPLFESLKIAVVRRDQEQTLGAD